MANSYFKFKKFTIQQDRSAMKVTTDGCLFGAWVANELQNKMSDAAHLLDIGTGTGLLTLMIAQKNPRLVINSVEVDKNAFIQAQENIKEAGFSNKIRVINVDIRKDNSESKHDFIVCNPPFYENELRSANNLKNLAHHDQGLFLEDLSGIIKSRLTHDGVFYLLLPYKRKNEIKSLFRKNHLFLTKTISVRPSAKHDYFRLLVEGMMHEKMSTTEEELSICDESGNYTPAFISLLSDYYLYL